MQAWAIEQREALRERLLRGGGEVEPAEAPWFRAAGLEVSLLGARSPGGRHGRSAGRSVGQDA